MLKELVLHNFRNYSKKKFQLEMATTLFIGPNAIGKTNILEAIYALASGKSFRAEEESEVIRGESDGVARVVGEGNGDQLEIIWDGRTRFHKLFKVNGVGKRQVDFVGILRAVLFSPTDLEIVTDSPSVRRKYLDSVLSQVYRDYRVAVSVYGRAIRQRNRLLWRMREEGVSGGEQLSYWNELLIEKGEIIHERRKEYLQFLTNYSSKPMAISLHYDHSIISAERLARYQKEERAAATTLVGPHRDDFVVYKKNDKNIKNYGSRGEQRLAVFTMKMIELEYISQVTGGRPMFLLDDIFSELDDQNRELIMTVVSKQQTIMTTAEEEVVDLLKRWKMTTVKLG